MTSVGWRSISAAAADVRRGCGRSRRLARVIAGRGLGDRLDDARAHADLGKRFLCSMMAVSGRAQHDCKSIWTHAGDDENQRDDADGQDFALRFEGVDSISDLARPIRRVVTNL